MKLEDFLNPTGTILPDEFIVPTETLAQIVTDEIDQQILSELDDFEIPEYLLNDPEAVGYPDIEMQNEIYKWVLQYVPAFADKTVKDLGCGRGDFGDNFFVDKYTGIDRNRIMIAAGKQKYPSLNLICDDYLNYTETTDYTVCIGTLNTFIGIEKWEWFDKTLAYALDTSNIAVVFVLQSKTELDGYLDYPINEILTRIPSKLPFKLDYTKFEDIYVLVVYKQPYS